MCSIQHGPQKLELGGSCMGVILHNTVLELQVYLSQVLHLFKISFIDGSPSIFLSLLTSERGSIHSCGLSNGVKKPSFITFSVDLVEIGVVHIQVYHLKSV